MFYYSDDLLFVHYFLLYRGFVISDTFMYHEFLNALGLKPLVFHTSALYFQIVF